MTSRPDRRFGRPQVARRGAHREVRHQLQGLDKIAGSDFEQPQAGPKGGGRDARSQMTCVVPSRYGVFSWYRTLPFGVTDRRFSAMAGRLI